jgi:hypothetical protein
MDILTIVIGWILAIFIGALGLLILYYIARGRSDLTRLISEPNGHASLSRFQFLVFTFVIALSFFLLVVSQAPLEFPAIPAEVFALLGISGGSYVVSKGIQTARDTREKELESKKAATDANDGVNG